MFLAIGESPMPVVWLWINAKRDQRQLGGLGRGQRQLKAPFQAFMDAVHGLLHHSQGRPRGADQGVPGFQWGCNQLFKALHHPMGTKGMGDPGD